MATPLLDRLENTYRSFLEASHSCPSRFSPADDFASPSPTSSLETSTNILLSKLSSLRALVRRPLIASELDSECGETFHFLTSGLDDAARLLQQYFSSEGQSERRPGILDDVTSTLTFQTETVNLLKEYLGLLVLIISYCTYRSRMVAHFADLGA